MKWVFRWERRSDCEVDSLKKKLEKVGPTQLPRGRRRAQLHIGVQNLIWTKVIKCILGLINFI